MDTRTHAHTGSLTPVHGTRGQAGVGRGEWQPRAHGLGGWQRDRRATRGCPGWGGRRRPRRRRKGRAGRRWACAPSPGRRRQRAALCRPPPQPRTGRPAPAGGVPGEQARPQDPLREAGRATLPARGPESHERLPGPPPTGPAPLSSAPISSGTGPALTPQTQHIAGPARWVPGPGLGRKGSESTACVPISQLRPPRPARDRSLRTREGTGRARRQLGCAPFPGRSGAALGHGMAFRPRAGVRRGPGPSRGPEAANAPQPPPRGAARRLGAFPPASELGPAGRVPGFLGRRPPPRSRRNKSDSSAWSCGRAGREGAERSGIPERAQRPPPGTQRGRGAGGWLRGRSPRS